MYYKTRLRRQKPLCLITESFYSERSSFSDTPESYALKFTRFQFLAQELDVLAHGGVVLEATLHGVDGM